MRQTWLGVFCVLVVAAGAVPLLEAQSGSASASPKQPAGSAAAALQTPASCVGEDRFASMRCVADQLLAAYQKVDDDNITDIEKLLKEKRCNIVRVDGLLSRAKDAMNLWFDAETNYWNEWEKSENARVEAQQKAVVSMEEEQATDQTTLDSLNADHDKLLREKAEMEKTPKRTQEIQKAIDELIKDIQSDEARIADAQKHLDDATLSVHNTKIALDARLVEIRQNQRHLEVWKDQKVSYYQTYRATADAVCSALGTNKPAKALPAPKGAQ